MPEALRHDVRLLADLLGTVLVENVGEDLLVSVEDLRHAVIAARRDTRLIARCDAIVLRFSPEWAELVARAFTCYFHLVNVAEEQHRRRALRERARSGSLPESVAATIVELRRRLDPPQLKARIGRLSIHPVLTAHPTEARRPEMIHVLRRIGRELERLDDPRATQGERDAARRALLEDIETLWRTSEIREMPTTVLDEVRATIAVLEETLFDVVPLMYEELDAALVTDESGSGPPVTPSFIRFGVWAGGDRDGNPYVTAAATADAFAIQLDRGLTALERSVSSLVAALMPEPGEGRQRDHLVRVLTRLRATRSGSAGAYSEPMEAIAELRLIQASLAGAGAARFSHRRVHRVIRQLETFGFTLAELEIRQHADVHSEALADIGRGSRSETTDDVLATLRTMRSLQRRHGVPACHRYVVSFAKSASDVAAVYALASQLDEGDRPVLDVVPLFERLDDLRRAPAILDDILALAPVQLRLAITDRHLEVMLGYSDSAKESGPFSAALALYDAQKALVGWATARDIRLTIFHGRGGALGRGGGPANRAILAQPPGSMDGGFKVTEQGEVIFARYGNAALARRHLEQVTSAMLLSSDPEVEERTTAAAARWHPLAERLDTIAHRTYRDLVETEGFVEWFGRVSPVDEIDALHLGSRPSRRKGRRTFSELRAIPWAFGWTQTRLNIPGWYGLGSAIGATDVRELRDAYAEWRLFAALIDNAEMSLAKTDREIAAGHLALGGRPDLTVQVLAEYDRTLTGILAILGEDHLLASRPVLSWAVALRNPYVDALSHLQLRAMRELDQAPGADELTRAQRLLVLTMNGIAAGLQNAG